MSDGSGDVVPASAEFLACAATDGAVKVLVLIKDETGLTQKALAQLFGASPPPINKHLNIFDSGELVRSATVSKMEIVQPEGGRQVARVVELYDEAPPRVYDRALREPRARSGLNCSGTPKRSMLWKPCRFWRPVDYCLRQLKVGATSLRSNAHRCPGTRKPEKPRIR